MEFSDWMEKYWNACTLQTKRNLLADEPELPITNWSAPFSGEDVPLHLQSWHSVRTSVGVVNSMTTSEEEAACWRMDRWARWFLKYCLEHDFREVDIRCLWETTISIYRSELELAYEILLINTYLHIMHGE